MTDAPEAPVTEPGGPVSAPGGNGLEPASKYAGSYTAKAQRAALQTDKAIRLYLSGWSQANAYTTAFRPRSAKKIASGYASEWFGQESVKERMEEICASLRASDLDNPGKVLSDLHRLLAMAETDKNHTACANYIRLRAQIAGIVTNSVNVRVEHQLTDKELVAKIAGDNAELAALLGAQLGMGSSFH